MLFEGLVLTACVYGNNDSCFTSVQQYAKYNRLDQQLEVIDNNIKKKYPAAHFFGATVGMAFYKKYNFMIYRNFWYEADYSNLDNKKDMVLFKYSF